MRSIIYICFVLSLIFFGCKKDTGTVSAEEQTTVELDSLSKEKIKVKLLKLSPEAKESVEKIEDFQHLKNLMQSMQSSNSFYIKKYADSMNILIQNFNENLSKEWKVNTIKSRISVLLTEAGLLLELSGKEHPESKKLLKANTQLVAAYNSLVIQLNELSLAIPDNIEKELLKEKSLFRDSIIDDPKK
ncbi:hypothetical protein GCM10022393_07790 [Aquimarina addita]|uniref:Lipoprotein n=1 Tax=Aquimarina addita TaxID=870485 RepID=A0ABP7XBJ3_9FLAO